MCSGGVCQVDFCKLTVEGFADCSDPDCDRFQCDFMDSTWCTEGFCDLCPGSYCMTDLDCCDGLMCCGVTPLCHPTMDICVDQL
jgi:hypothetical protein